MGTTDLQCKSLKRRLLSCVTAIALNGNTMAPFSTAVAEESPTLTPIKHVIVIIGENCTFDHIFATYKPVNKGEKALNLLSKRIVNDDGSPGPNYGEALQYPRLRLLQYNLTPPKAPYDLLPPALTGGPGTPYGCQLLGIGTSTSTSPTECDTPANEAALKKMHIQPIGLPDDYYKYLLTGGTGQASKVPDARIDYDGHNAEPIAARTVPDHFEDLPIRLLRGEPCPSLLPDVAAARLRRRRSRQRKRLGLQIRSVPMGRNGHLRPRERQGKALALHRYDERLDRDGLLQRSARRCALFQGTRRQVYNERQFSSVRARRHWREPHHARHRRRHVVQRWKRQPKKAPGPPA